MDPNATLANLRQAIVDTNNYYRAHGGMGRAPAAVLQLFDAVCALDEWLTSGGFLPTDWKGDK